MVWAVNALEPRFTQLGAGGIGGSDQIFNHLLDQIKQGSAGHLSPHLLEQILQDLAENKLTLEQAVQLIDTAQQNGSPGTSQGTEGSQGTQGSVGTQGAQGRDNGTGDAGDFLTKVLQDVIAQKISPEAAAQLIQAAETGQGGGVQTAGLGAPETADPVVSQIVQDVANGQLSPQAAAELLAAWQQNGQSSTQNGQSATEPASYSGGAGGANLSQFLLTLLEGVATGQITPSEASKLIEAAPASSQLEA
jgi:hypothetical protein